MIKVIKRDGREVDFDKQKITIAVLSALNETREGDYNTAKLISDQVCSHIKMDTAVEKIQDFVEQILMSNGFYKTSKEYILYRNKRTESREYENGLMKQIAGLSKETNRDNANVSHSPASKMYQIGSVASKAYYSDYLIPKHLIDKYNEGLFHIHDYDYYDKTINCLSIPLKRILTNMKDYPFDYGCFKNPKRIESVMSVSAIILQRISNDLFGGTMLPNLDIVVQELVDEKYIEIPTEKEVENAIQGLLCDLSTMASRAGNQIPFSSITFGLSTGKYGRMVTKHILNEFLKGMGNGETFIFPNLTFKCKEGISFNHDDPNYDLYELAVKASARRMNPTFTFLDTEAYKGYDPKEVNIMGCVDKHEVVTYKYNKNLYVESFERMWNRLAEEFEVKNQIENDKTNNHLYIDLSNVEIYDTKHKFVKTYRIIRNLSNDWYRVKLSNGRVVTCTKDHPFYTENRGVITAGNLLSSDIITTNPEQYSEETIDFDADKAWTLGMILCDGCYTSGVSVSIAKNGEDDIEIKYKEMVNKFFNMPVQSTIQNRGVRGNYKDLLALGKAGELKEYLTDMFEGTQKIKRHIPNDVFSWNKSAKLGFLAGMVDADGYINKNTHGGSVVQIGSTNKELALQQMALAQSLGMYAKIYINHYSKDKDKIRYRVEFKPNEELLEHIVCNKKVNNFVPSKKDNIHRTSHVTSVEKIDMTDYSYDVTTESGYFEVSGIFSHNCRTFVIGNINGELVSEGRGNLFPTTINLPRVALLTEGINYKKDVESFFHNLDNLLESVKELSLHRLGILSKLRAKDIPYLMENHVYYGIEDLQPEDSIEPALKQGSIAIGYIGIAEAVKCLIGKHHGETEEALDLALKINEHIRNYCDEQIEETGYNWSCYATPAESTINKVFKDKVDFGIIDGVTDQDFYTNSFHVPVHYPITFAKKIAIEGLFHEYNNGGRITYIELDSPPIHNIEGIIGIHKYMSQSNVCYAGINFPIDECRSCGHSGIFKDVCSSCGSSNILKIRRVSGYLGYTERINPSKAAEIKARVSHNGTNA